MNPATLSYVTNEARIAHEAVARGRVVREAYEWLGTPFHHEGRVKGRDGGVDCAMLVAEVFERAGQIPRQNLDHYAPAWWHRRDDRYVEGVLKYWRETAMTEPQPADLILFRIGRSWAHSGIVVQWPTVIHAYCGRTVELADATKEPLSPMERRVFTLREWT